MASKPIRDRLTAGSRRGYDGSGRVPARSRHLQGKPPVSEEELERTVHEYRHVHEEHRRAHASGRVRRKLEARLRRVRRRFERRLAEAPLSDPDRRRWRAVIRYPGARPAAHVKVRPVLFRGRSEAGSELVLLPMPDGALEAVVDGTTVEVLDLADELESTSPGFVFALEGTEFRETFAVPRSALDELRAAVEGGGAPPPESLRELVEDGLVERTLGLTTRGRRALALDRSPAHRTEPAPSPEITLRGPVPGRARADLVRALTHVVHVSPQPVLHTRGSLTRHEDPALARPVVAKATLDLGGHAVRAQAAAASEREAIALLESRLRRNLRKLAERRLAERHERGAREDGERRRGELPASAES